MESGDVAYLGPPFPADTHALGTTLLEGGEDDEDIDTVWYCHSPNFGFLKFYKTQNHLPGFNYFHWIFYQPLTNFKPGPGLKYF